MSPAVRGPQRGAQRTRARILAEALKRYNARGVAAVSSEHVAGALGISQGNLAYHFPRKKDLVLALFGEREARIAALFADLDASYRAGGEAAFGTLALRIGELFAIVWAYRFISRDLGHLAGRFPEVADAWRRENERMAAVTEGLFRRAADDGWMRPEPEPGAFARRIHALQVQLNFSVVDAAARGLGPEPYAALLLDAVRDLCTTQGRALLPARLPLPAALA
jgi:AcrR family transcriptional regulator